MVQQHSNGNHECNLMGAADHSYLCRLVAAGRPPACVCSPTSQLKQLLSWITWHHDQFASLCSQQMQRPWGAAAGFSRRLD